MGEQVAAGLKKEKARREPLRHGAGLLRSACASVDGWAYQ